MCLPAPRVAATFDIMHYSSFCEVMRCAHTVYICVVFYTALNALIGAAMDGATTNRDAMIAFAHLSMIEAAAAEIDHVTSLYMCLSVHTTVLVCVRCVCKLHCCCHECLSGEIILRCASCER